MTKEDFIKKAIAKFGNKYDYSKVNYINNHTKICIICPEHGEFEIEPNNFIHGKGCMLCQRKKNFYTFLSRANTKFNGKYKYFEEDYINAHTKIRIICPIHGEFWQTPDIHLHSKGCKLCKDKYRTNIIQNTNDFISAAKKIHHNKYDYSKTIYVNEKIKVKVICPEHGEFEIEPNSHLNGRGCIKCTNKQKSNTDDFIKRAKKIHGNKYDYSKVDYINNHTKVIIICPEHGVFMQTPKNHLNGQKCPKCSSNYHYTTEEFIEKCKIIHNNKYQYDKTKYIDAFHMIEIKCPLHGYFWQKASSHLNGCGCQKCNQSKMEIELSNFLTKNKIQYEQYKKFDWMGKMSVDFYLPKYNSAIECQGEQHFESIEYFGGNKKLTKQIERDKIKQKLCNEHNLTLFYYTNLEKYKTNNIFANKDELLNKIKNDRNS